MLFQYDSPLLYAHRKMIAYLNLYSTKIKILCIFILCCITLDNILTNKLKYFDWERIFNNFIAYWNYIEFILAGHAKKALKNFHGSSSKSISMP